MKKRKPPYKKPGSAAVLVLWIILVGPFAIIYWLLRSWGWQKREMMKWEEGR